jgi:hypothetical protein
MKQRCKDVYVINNRLRGLAGKKFKTQKIVLTNTKKIRVRSKKFYGGAGLRRCNRSRGFSTNFARHRNLPDNYRIFQGLICNSFTAQLQWRQWGKTGAEKVRPRVT